MKYRNIFAVMAISLALGAIPVTASAQISESVSADCAAHHAEPGHIGQMASSKGGQHIADMAQMGHDGQNGLGHMASMYSRNQANRLGA